MNSELKPFADELNESLKWFRQARETALRGELQAAAYCLDHGLAILTGSRLQC
jgi:hypothetical protein